MVKALVWGTREPGFKSRRPDELSGVATCAISGVWRRPGSFRLMTNADLGGKQLLRGTKRLHGSFP